MTPTDATDHDLLRAYAVDGAQAAFAELVQRHLNLVYSVALRQVRSTHLAEEVAQSVFADLARSPTRPDPAQPLVAWLHVVSRRAAIDVVRRESRRQAREQQAAALASVEPPASVSMKPLPSAWAEVEPLLDEAVDTLDAADRCAILLRFFENKSLREIGTALGTSEDTAQKRVSRALDRLRVFLAGRGVTVTGAALATDLSAHAVEAAPATLGATISAVGAAGPIAATGTAHLVVMTTLQKSLAIAVVVAALGFALYEGLPAVRLGAQVQSGQQQLDALAETARQLRLEQTATARQLAALNQGRSTAQTSPEAESDAALAREAAAWSARIARLKQAFAQHPEKAIPELSLLRDHDWILAAQGEDFSREEDVNQSLRFLRTTAKGEFLDRLLDATRTYLATAQALPDRFDQLIPHFQPSLDPAIFARYDFQQEAKWLVVTEKIGGAVDPDRLAFAGTEYTGGPNGFKSFFRMETTAERSVREAVQAYVQSHDGARPAGAAQVLPLLAEPVEPAALAKILRTLPPWLQPATPARR